MYVEYRDLQVPMTLKHDPITSSGKSLPGPDPRIRHRIQIGMFRTIRVDHSISLRPIASFLATVTRILNPSLQVQTFSTSSNVRYCNAYGQFADYKSDYSKLVPNPVVQPKTDWRSGSVVSKAKPKRQHVPKQTTAADPARPQAGRGNVGGTRPPATVPPRHDSCRPSMSVLGRSNASSVVERRSIQFASQGPRTPSSTARPSLPHRASKNSLSHTSLKCGRLWFPGKGTRNMAPQVSCDKTSGQH
jgi:hypothetical protein